MAKNTAPTKAALVAAIKDMNNTLGLEPPMDHKGTADELKEVLTVNVDNIEADDPIKKATVKTLQALGLTVPGHEEETTKKGGKKKKAAAKKGGAKKETTKKKKSTEPKEPRYLRENSVVEALSKKAQSLDDLAATADELYTKATGKASNPSQSRHVVGITLRTLKVIDYVEITEDGEVKLA